MVSVISASRIGLSDAALVLAAREGNRDAFGQIVGRYQGMVSGTIYAACGDLHRSEDLAQETFLSAWRSLSGLREPTKLAAWLCQIARHRAQDDQRKLRTEKVGIGGFWARQEQARDDAASPHAEVIRKEEEAVLWRALEQIAQPYRETLVLYYRQGRSTEDVAAAMETSEASVHQRLSRGREMLRGQLAEMVERNLERSAPSAAFTSGVLSTLPAILPAAAQAASVSSAAKGSLAAGKSGWFALLVPWLGLAGGLASGIGGSVGALRDDRTPSERRLTVRFLATLWSVVAFLLIGAVALLHLHIRLRWSDEVFIPALAGFFALYWMVMSAVVMRYQARSFALRDADRPPPSLANGSIAIASGLAIGVGTAIGALAWMIQLARVAGDGLGALTVVVLIAVVSTVNIFALRRAPRLMLPVATVAICAAIVVMVNWRLNTWIAAQRGTTPVQTDLPLWSINLAAAIMVLWVGACWMLYARATRVPIESRP